MKNSVSSVILSLFVAIVALCAQRTNGLPLYEPFDYASGSALGVTNAGILTGWSVVGYTNAPMDGSDQIFVTNVNLSVPGLASSSGNSVTFGAAGWSARIPIGPRVITLAAGNTLVTNSYDVTSGTLYYSFAFRVDDLGLLNGTGGFLAGFNNLPGAQPNFATTIAARVLTRANVSGGYDIGIEKSSGMGANFTFDDVNHQVGETNFVVVSYTFVGGDTTNDACLMWINPDPSTFGAPVAPASTLEAKIFGTDQTVLRTLYLRQQSDSAVPGVLILDELRVATTWACVTPPANAPAPTAPMLEISRSGTSVILSWLTNQTCLTLQSTFALPADSNFWTTVSGPIGIVGDKFTVTNSASTGNKFYRLRTF